MITAIILEDELIASNRLSRMIHELDPDIKILKVFDSISDTRKFYDTSIEQPDILFLDIHVADGNSFELFNHIKIESKIIFTTAYNEYAIEALRKEAKDYLLKPIKSEELDRALDKATAHIQRGMSDSPKSKERFLFKFGAKLHSVKISDIRYIFSKNKNE